MVCPSLILHRTVPVSSELQKEARITTNHVQEKIEIPPREETVRNFPERARNNHDDTSEICASGTSGQFYPSGIQERYQKGSSRQKKNSARKGETTGRAS